MLVGIVGYGVVGRGTAALFKDVVVHDPAQGYGARSDLGSCTIVFLCLPTPTLAGGDSDLSAVHDACEEIAPLLSRKQVVAIRSTVPPGTARRLQESWPNTHFASNPEFLRAHRWREDSLRPLRVVIGADSDYARRALLKAYHARLKGRVPYVVTDSVTAELIKYAANCFLATKITYAREMRRLAGFIGAQYGDIVRALALDPRIGDGAEWRLRGLVDECLPKDLQAFVRWLQERRLDVPLLDVVLAADGQVALDRALAREGGGQEGAAGPELSDDDGGALSEEPTGRAWLSRVRSSLR